jgi:hypothetical protein
MSQCTPNTTIKKIFQKEEEKEKRERTLFSSHFLNTKASVGKNVGGPWNNLSSL